MAAVLSFLLCGLGQIYNGQIAKGLFMMLLFGALVGLAVFAAGAGSAICLLAGALAVGLWVFGMVDGKDTALRSQANERESGGE